MVVPVVLALLQGSRIALIPFVDDGTTKTHLVPPFVVRLSGAEGLKQTILRIGTTGYRILVSDGPLGRTMFVDRNGNGKGESSERVKLDRQNTGGQDGKIISVYMGVINLPGNVRYGTQSFLSSTKDPQYVAVRDSLRLFPLSGYIGKASIGGKPYRIGVRGTDLANGYLFIDRDQDGVLGTVQQELFALGKPFSIDGKSYKVTSFKPVGKPQIAFGPSSVKVAENPMPADLRVGKIVPSVAGKTLAGKVVNFPKSFPGKLVLLDVWATWCGPCRSEIPYMKAAYAKYRSRGFEICSMSIDDPNMGPQVAAFTKSNGMGWTQVFQGRGWQSPVCQRYNITGIPFMLLVDGSTGKILAREDRLRGPGILEATVAQYLAKR